MSKFSPLKLRQRGNSIVAMLSAFLLLFLFSTNLVAQSVPEAINYQAIVRDAESFLPISDQGAYVSVEFLDGPDGDVLYQEEFSSIQTGKAGLINLSLGQGDPMINSFESISWETGNVWLRLSVDIGNGLNILQETPFNTVPYAFYANSSGSSNADGDSDSTNEFQDLGNTVVTPNEEVEITLTDGANTTINIQDADANATNELQNIESTDGSISVTPSGNDFDLSVAAADGSETIVNDGQNTTVNGSGTFADPYAIDVPDNLDNDPVNEIQDISTDNTAGNIAISDGSTLTINVNDADADATNELQNIESTDGSISVTPSGNDFDLSVAAADGSETIVNDGQNTTVNGSGTFADPYAIDVPDNLDNDILNEIQDISTDNTAGNIAISDGSTLTINVDDADADVTNELQTIESTDGSITVTPNGNDFDLSVAPTDGSETIVNDGQNTTVNGSGNSADPYVIDVPDNLDNDILNEIQDISTDNTAGNIAISDGSTLTINVDDADADATNELQTIESTDGSITVTPSGNDFDLSVAATDGSETIVNDGQNTTVNGSGTSADPYAIDVPDNLDNDATNEFQDLGNTVVTPNEEVEITLTDGANTTINIQDADADGTNELQNIESTDGSISVTPSGNDFDLSVAAADGSETIVNDGQNTTVNGSGTSADPYVIDVPDNLDNDATNEFQDLGNIVVTPNEEVEITLTDGANTTINIQDADADATNELQNIESTDGSISVTPSGNDFDLSVAAADGSETIVNDGQNTTVNGSGTSADPYAIDVPDNLDNDPVNEIQDISTDNTAGNIVISDGSTLTINVNDADADATNELQNIESTDGSISVTPSGNDFDLSVAAADGSETIVNDGQNTTVNGSGTSADPYVIDVPDNLDNDPVNEIQDISTDNTAGNIAISDGSALTINVDDADANPENELQNIQLSGDFLSLTNVSPAAQVDMRQFDQSDLSQGHIFIGDGSDEASEVQVFGDIELDSTGDSKVRGIQGVDVSGTAPDNGDVLVYSSTTSEWRPRSPSSVVNPSVTSYYSIDPLDFRELVDPLIGVDLDEGGSLKFYDDDAPFAMLINDAGIIEIMAPLHLPHGAEITNLKMYLRDNIGAGMRVSLYRKRMTDYSVGNDVLSAVLIGGPAGDKELNVNITNLNTVDNINYSYRIYVRFDTNGLENDNDASIDDIEQAVYGGVIEYTTN